MSIDLTRHHRYPFAPPLQLPLRLRVPRGIFGIDRNRETMNFQSPLRCDGESIDELTRRTFHTGIDLLAGDGCPVFAARRGEVVDVTSELVGQTVVIAHNINGLGYITRYLHLDEVYVSAGVIVEAGVTIGTVIEYSDDDRTPDHLHFEIRLVINNDDPTSYWHKENTEFIDPTRNMYDWEMIYYEQVKDIEPDTQDPTNLSEVGILRLSSVPMFQTQKAGPSSPSPGGQRLYMGTTITITYHSMNPPWPSCA
ncbi:MAG: M23 family metallopeptidase [Candidatus Scalindua sp.]|nr:M23 family metallopeptidase [Candidatus Scalindua sp.]